MTKAFVVFTLGLAAALPTFGADMCYETYLKKGMEPKASAEALACYEKQLSQKPADRNAQAAILNQISYLNFFIAEEVTDKKKRATHQEAAMTQAEAAATLYGGFLDMEAYKQLDSESRRVLSRSLYLYGIALARHSEEKGGLTVVTNWPKIRNTMQTVLRLGHADVEFYGAHRTLAIANTRMPAVFGDRKLARQYFDHIIQKTQVEGGVSALIVNNFLFAELLAKTGDKAGACAQLEKAANVTDEFIQQNAAEQVFESRKQRDEARAELQKQCARR